MAAILDGLAFQLLGYRGPLGRWAVARVIDVWMRQPEGESPW